MNTLPWLSSSSTAAKLKRRASNLREECPHPALQFVPRLFDILVWQGLETVSIIKKWLRKRIYFIFSFHTDKKRVRRINMKWKRPRKKVCLTKTRENFCPTCLTNWLDVDFNSVCWSTRKESGKEKVLLVYFPFTQTCSWTELQIEWSNWYDFNSKPIWSSNFDLR